MLIIAVIAVAMAIVTERWRWGFPRRVPYDKTTAIAWLSTVSRSDVRKYDRGDVDLLLEDICKWRMLIGRTKKQIAAELGPADDPTSFLIPTILKKNHVLLPESVVGSRRRFPIGVSGALPAFRRGREMPLELHVPLPTTAQTRDRCD